MGFQEGNTDLEHCTFRKKEFEVQWFAVWLFSKNHLDHRCKG
jgi:hypothetical protein